MSTLENPFVLAMLGVMVALLLVIKSLSSVLLTAAKRSWAEGKKVKAGAMAAVAAPMINGVSDATFYMLVSIVALEVVVILYLLYNLHVLLKEDLVREEKSRKSFDYSAFWTRINRFRPATEEAAMDLGHDYDGIRELDNKLPPWWLYGFYATIIFACVYLWRYHVSHSAPLPAEEYKISVQQAEIKKQEYLKNAANSVDENTVKLLTSTTDLDAGKAIFQSTCFACHGKNGEGGVGPNLTDAYWLHGGTVQDVFKTIKYGWPDKGMKSWKDDFSPGQIAQIASYVKSLAGTNPPNAKAPQGELMK